ncbi:butyrophilin-like protein 2 [Chanodichthys erythropterus]|uniref:butyrophilin-like protein 2 n=1 Tax=Chanodichthys erythropterus TaxID=933992 RepID=UPI00351E0AB9
MAARGGNDFQLVIPERGERVKINSRSTLTVSCHLSPAISAVDMEVTWYGGTSCVCTYKNREMTQGVDYEGRASLFIHDLMKGNVSLRVTDFRESDLGVYMCQVTSQNTTQQITVNVAEEVSAIFKDQCFFTVDYKVGETSNELSNQSAYHGDSDHQLEDYKMGNTRYKLSIRYAYCSASGKDQHKSAVTTLLRGPGEARGHVRSHTWHSPCDSTGYKRETDNGNLKIETLDLAFEEGLFVYFSLHYRIIIPGHHISFHHRTLYFECVNKSVSPSFFLFLTDNFQLVAPSTAEEPEVSFGSDFIIPCHLSPGISALDMEIRWSKGTASVCLFKDRQLTEGVWFKGRVCLFMTHKLKKGNVSLHLKNFMLSDVGNYHCQVISKDRSEELNVRVRINPVSQSAIQDGNVQLLPHEDKMTRMTMKPSNVKLTRHTSHRSESDKKQHGNYSMGVSSNDNFQLVIPQTTQEATISMGSEFFVPCSLSPEICATAMQIKWFKDTDCVCVYKKSHMIEGRAYKDRVSLVTHELERGNVSLHLSNFSVSDVGDYYCQVISRGRTKEITVGVRTKPEVQPVSLSPTSQDRSIQLMLFEIDKIWTEEETNKMDESALMTEMKVNNVQELQKMLIKAYTEKDRQLERTEQDLRETRMDLDRVLRLSPHAQFLNNPSHF